MTEPRTIVVATGNPGKLAEITAILDGVGADLRPMSDYGLPSPDETEGTFAGNALLKARAVVAAIGLPALADDSGLEVDTLDGAPGVISARWAGEPSDDAANNAKLVRALQGVPETERSARYVAVAVLVAPDGREWTARGTMEGHIVDEARGTGGFGYDPLFVLAGDTRRLAELAPAEKDAHSHRGEAFRAIRPHVEALVGS